MNVTRAQLRAQYENIRPRIGELVDAAEKAFSLPPRVMWAVFSRETNLDPYWVDHPGDGGHGRGLPAKLGQIDDRSHTIPDDWATNLAWQIGTSAEIFHSCLVQAGGDVVKAANRYNSGQEDARYTTGGDYGPDVFERRLALVEMFPTQEEEFVAMNSLVNLNSGYALEVPGGSKEDRTPLGQWSCNGQRHQSLVFEDQGQGLVRIRFEHSDKYLDADANRLEAVQFSKADVPGQLWRMLRRPNGATVVQSTVDGRVLDVEAESKDPGARVILWPEKSSAEFTIANQQWVVVHFR